MRIKRLIILIIVPQVLTLMGCRAKISYGNNMQMGRYYIINGFKMYVEVYGSGPPLLMIHGNGGDMSAFTENVPYFAKKYQVILADSRAQGKSADAGDTLSFEQMADDFAALLDTLHITKAYLLGWSDGGINALCMAMRHPGKVIKLAATGANLWPGTTALDPAGWQQSQKYYNENKATVWKTAKAKNAWKLFMLNYEQPQIKLSQLRQVKCPALIITGDHDVIVDGHTRLIAKNIPGARLWIVPRSGHATLIEHSKIFNKKVDAFFEE